MKGWTLEYVRSLDEDEYDEMVLWIKEQQSRSEHGDSIDADAIVDAMDAKKQHEANGDGDH